MDEATDLLPPIAIRSMPSAHSRFSDQPSICRHHQFPAHSSTSPPPRIDQGSALSEKRWRSYRQEPIVSERAAPPFRDDSVSTRSDLPTHSCLPPYRVNR